MPKFITLELDKDKIYNLLKSKDQNSVEMTNVVKFTAECEFEFLDGELASLSNFISQNKTFQNIKLKFSPSIDLKNILTDDLIAQKVPNLLITVKEKDYSSSNSINEYH